MLRLGAPSASKAACIARRCGHFLSEVACVRSDCFKARRELARVLIGKVGLDLGPPRSRAADATAPVVVITASLARWNKFRIHVRAGLEQKGFTRDELKEALMQTAIYAGVPAANTAFAEAMKILADLTPAETTA